MAPNFLFSEGWHKRLAVFSISACCILVLCIAFGYYGGIRTDRILNRMIEDGELTARGWRIVSSDEKGLTVTKFNRTIYFKGPVSDAFDIGDYVSFTARKKVATDLWVPVNLHVHGTSVTKFLVSIAALVIVGAMAWRYIRFDRQSCSLTYKSRK